MSEINSPQEVLTKLKKLTKKVESTISQMSTCEITLSQMRVIFPIFKNVNGYTMQQLCQIIDVDKSLVSRTINELEIKGIIKRDKKSVNSERNYNIVLTEKGEQIKNDISRKVEKLSFDIKEIPKKDLVTFINVLDKLTKD